MDRNGLCEEDAESAEFSQGEKCESSQPKCCEHEHGMFKYEYASSHQGESYSLSRPSHGNAFNRVNSSTAIVIPRREWLPFSGHNVSGFQTTSNSIQWPFIFNSLIRHWISSGIYDMIRSSSLTSQYLSSYAQLGQPASISLQQNVSYDELELLRLSYEQSVVIIHMLNSGTSPGSLSLRFNTSQNGRQGILLLGQSPFFNVVDMHDRYEDMRLDVENMSYEELLDLEDRIGDVGTGVSDEEIDSYLKHRKYFVLVETHASKESCLICQEDYIEEDELGSLNCGHDFHHGCIKQWLRCKNTCPVCKSTGLITADPSITHKNDA